ncbi:S53 family peptidase [Herbaspirillum sp. CF444]|uniref:S53 family peptidase n=1 Tax=Herbaspirillum sp. CF444 TaxID=1144319 RepID=UPI00138B1A41|nr:S53 family peptidase [Herbaspirillum sp. CF444]
MSKRLAFFASVIIMGRRRVAGGLEMMNRAIIAINFIVRVIFTCLLLSTSATADADNRWADTKTLAFLPPYGDPASSYMLYREHPVHIQVALKVRNQERLDEMARDVNDPESSEYGNFLTREQFQRDFAPVEEQVDAIKAYLQVTGFTQVEATPNRLFVSAVGSVRTIEAAFNTKLAVFKEAGRVRYANTSIVQVPMSLAGIVLAVQGLQNIDGPHPFFHHADAVRQPFVSPLASPHWPAEFSTIYDGDSLGAAHETSLGIITLGEAPETLKQMKVDYPQLIIKTIRTGDQKGNYDGLDSDIYISEASLDAHAAIGTAGGALKQMIFYAAEMKFGEDALEASITRAFNRAVSDNEARVISVSLGECEESAYKSGTLVADSQIFSIAVAQGQTFVVATGDHGAYDCQGGELDGGNYSVDWPAASANVVAVGGTRLYTYGQTVHAMEEVWNHGLYYESETSKGTLIATGGGYSKYISRPAWQSALTAQPMNKRALPDIAFDADRDSGILIKIDGKAQQGDGTSLSAPLFAGFYARIQTTFGNKLGFPCPLIYEAGRTDPEVFHDVISGNNGWEGFGYSAGRGWDYASGWGSVDIAKLAAFIRKMGSPQRKNTRAIR